MPFDNPHVHTVQCQAVQIYRQLFVSCMHSSITMASMCSLKHSRLNELVSITHGMLAPIRYCDSFWYGLLGFR